MTHQQAALRREVGLLRERESRRVFDSTFAVGRLGAGLPGFALGAHDRSVVDVGLRADVVSALLEQSGAGLVSAWVSRCGCPTLHDVDLHWLAAATIAFGMHDRALTGFYAITRRGWLDVRTGERRIWKRLRL